MKKMEDMLKAMNESMQAMQAVIQDQHAFIKSQGEAIEVLKSKITSGEGSLTGSTDKERQKQRNQGRNTKVTSSRNTEQNKLLGIGGGGTD